MHYSVANRTIISDPGRDRAAAGELQSRGDATDGLQSGRDAADDGLRSVLSGGHAADPLGTGLTGGHAGPRSGLARVVEDTRGTLSGVAEDTRRTRSGLY